jgi:phosphoglycerol transferase
MNAIGHRLSRGLAALVFAAAALFYVIPYFDIPKSLSKPPSVYVLAGLIALVAAAVLAPVNGSRQPWRLSGILFAVALLSLAPFVFTAANFGTRDVESLMIAFRENQFVDLLQVGAGDFFRELAEHVGIFAAGVGAAIFLSVTLIGFRHALAGLSLAMLALGPLSQHARALFVPEPAHALIDPVRDIRPPVIAAIPAETKNLILVYLESVERTYRDIPATRDAFASFARMEDAGVSARNVGQVNGTHFTAAAMVASQCGVPLYPRGIFDVRGKETARTPDRPLADFMSGITCLGDVLKSRGYEGTYITGSDPGSFSIGDFYRAHGFETVAGREAFPDWAARRRSNIWGVNDDVMFERIEAWLTDRATRSTPFVLSLLTIATHGPDSELDENCRPEPGAASRIPAAIACTGRHVQRLIDRVAALGLADRTVIVVMSDHFAMRNTIWPELVRRNGARRNLFTILGAGPPRVLTGNATTLDYFPTILEAMGYRLDGGRANLGVSLLSGEPTRAASLGIETLEAAIAGNSRLRDFVWTR